MYFTFLKGKFTREKIPREFFPCFLFLFFLFFFLFFISFFFLFFLLFKKKKEQYLNKLNIVLF